MQDASTDWAMIRTRVEEQDGTSYRKRLTPSETSGELRMSRDEVTLFCSFAILLSFDVRVFDDEAAEIMVDEHASTDDCTYREKLIMSALMAMPRGFLDEMLFQVFWRECER